MNDLGALAALLLAAFAASACGAEAGAVTEDACKLADDDEPFLVVGEGRSAYADLDDHAIVPLEAGPQGGHHLWLAVRTRGLTQAGSVLTVEGRFPELDADPPPFRSGVTFHTAEDDYCELYGIRFQVDREIEVAALRGQSLELEVSVRDADDTLAAAEKKVRLAD